MRNLKSNCIPAPISDTSHINFCAREIGAPVGLHWHDFYEIELIVAGEGVSTINEAEFSFSRGALSFLTPADFHSITPKGEVKLLNLSFSPSAMDNALDASLGFYMLDEETACRMESILSFLGRELSADGTQNKAYVSHLLAVCLIEIARLKKQNAATVSDAPARRLLQYVYAHASEDLSISRVAAEVGFSAGYAGRVFKRHVGKSFKEFLNSLRLRRAKNLLLHTEASVTEIAFSCGFGTVTHFLRVFRKDCGMSPLVYRKSKKTSKVYK